jgi:hypothetical protein
MMELSRMAQAPNVLRITANIAKLTELPAI